jgi:hypothetical protein
VGAVDVVEHEARRPSRGRVADARDAAEHVVGDRAADAIQDQNTEPESVGGMPPSYTSS